MTKTPLAETKPSRPFEYALMRLNEDPQKMPEVIYINGDKSAMRVEAEKRLRTDPSGRYVITVFNGMVQAVTTNQWTD